MSNLNSLTPEQARQIVEGSPFLQSALSRESSPMTSRTSSQSSSPLPTQSCIVRLDGLKKNPELNGKIAIVGEYNGERYYVLPIKKDGDIISVLPDKIKRANLDDIQGGGRKRKSHKNRHSKRNKRSKRSKSTKRTKRSTRTKRNI